MGALSQYRRSAAGDLVGSDPDAMYRTIVLYWSAVRDTFPDAWGKPPSESRLMHSAGIRAMAVLMDQIMLRAEFVALAGGRHTQFARTHCSALFVDRGGLGGPRLALERGAVNQPSHQSLERSSDPPRSRSVEAGAMMFIFADGLDVVDPGYDFVQDRNSEGRSPYWDDIYPHELMARPPYDGILISRGIVGGDKISGKYTRSQAMRLRRVGARIFLRLDKLGLEELPIFGDCGAFTYHKEETPPYTPEETAAFYDDGGFTHGCSVDHIIFDFDEALVGMEGGAAEAHRRFDITLENAAAFLSVTRHMSNRFTPLGVIQGWSPGSMAESARRLCAMGYDYLALGGTVPLKASQIKACLRAIRDAVPSDYSLAHPWICKGR